MCTSHAYAVKSPIFKSAASDRKFYKELHVIADKLEPKVRKEFLKAIEQLRKSVTVAEIRTNIEDGRSIDSIIRMFDFDELGISLEDMTSELQAAFSDTAVASMANLGAQLNQTMRFDLLNQKSVEFLRQYKFNLIKDMTASARKSVQEVVTTAFVEGGHPFQQARKIKDFVGLLPRQAKAVDNYRALLVSEGRNKAQIERMVEAYRKRQLRYRARVIARTETIRAANAGQLESWRQSVENGFLPATVKKQWVVTPDDLLCPICEPIPKENKGGVPLSGTFKTSVGDRKAPPAHPQCRCALSLTNLEG